MLSDCSPTLAWLFAKFVGGVCVCAMMSEHLTSSIPACGPADRPKTPDLL